MSNALRWWQEGIIYQLVVASFRDTNDDGIGDLPGVIEGLDYLQWLGVRAIWLSPIHPSPMADLGYDVTDFRNVDPRFGTLDDFDHLLDEAHRRGLKIILDWVPNHTSDEHPWFVESRSSRENPRRDWYVWCDPRPDGSPPNNWISIFGGRAWAWDESTGQYYHHHFLNKQPELNWRNPAVQEEMFATMRFWLDRGVDGYRVDALDLLLEDEQLRDNPPNPDFREGDGPDSRLLPQYTRDQPGIHDLVARMRAVVDEYDDRFIAGELYLPLDQAMTYYNRERPELHLPLNLKLAWTDWDAEKIRRTAEEYLAKLPDFGWPTWTLSTHDCPRLAARCPGAQARVAAMLLATLPGALTHYYGEEIGMRGKSIPAEQAIDPQGRRTGRNRDPARTPMQWSGAAQAGFSASAPWLAVGDDFPTANVATERDDPRSMLSLYRRLFALRSERSMLVSGRLEFVAGAPAVLAYRRTGDGGPLRVVLNLQGEPQDFVLGDDLGRIVLSTSLDREGDSVEGTVALRPDEGVILALE